VNARSQGQLIAAAGGVLLFFFLFLPWFGSAATTGGTTSLSGWEGQSTTDIYLLITALFAIGTALTARGRAAPPGATMNGATFLLGLVASVLMLWLAVFDFPAGEDRKIGVYVSLLACLVIAYGAFRAIEEESGTPARRERRPARRPREPVEPAGDPNAPDQDSTEDYDRFR
jgi:hypothetical protein